MHYLNNGDEEICHTWATGQGKGRRGSKFSLDDIIYSQISNNLSEILFSYISRHEKGNPDPDQKSFDGLSRFSRNSVIVS